MVKLTLIDKEPIPDDACTTVGAILPRVFCCITGEKANVYRNKKCIRKFQHSENGMLKMDKVRIADRRNATMLMKQVTSKGPLLLKKKNKFAISIETSNIEKTV